MAMDVLCRDHRDEVDVIFEIPELQFVVIHNTLRFIMPMDDPDNLAFIEMLHHIHKGRKPDAIRT